MPISAETALSKRGLFVLNGIALIGLYLGFLIHLSGTSDSIILGLAKFLAFSGGTLGALASLAGALGSKRTTDVQNLGLFLWAGLLLVVTTFLIGII